MDDDFADGDDNSLLVRQRLLTLIASGDPGPEGRLPAERDLCDRRAVGRRVLRRALESLEAEGLIWRQQGKGTFAGQPPDPAGQIAAGIGGETSPLEVMEARLCIEPVLARHAAARASAADVGRMRELAARVVAAADMESTGLWDGALHHLIARTGGNRPLPTAFSILDEIRANPGWRDRRHRARSAMTLRVSDSQHHAIIDAIEAGDGPGAEAAMRVHPGTLSRNLERQTAGSAPDQVKEEMP